MPKQTKTKKIEFYHNRLRDRIMTFITVNLKHDSDFVMPDELTGYLMKEYSEYNRKQPNFFVREVTMILQRVY